MNFLTFFLAFDSWIDLFLLILGVIVKFFWIFLQCLCDQVAPAETPKQPDLSTNNRPHSSCEVQHDSGLGHYGPIGHYSYPDLTRASRCASLPRTVADVSSLTISNPWEIPHNVTATAPLFENSGVEEREKISPRSKVRLNLPFVPRLYLSSIRPILFLRTWLIFENKQKISGVLNHFKCLSNNLTEGTGAEQKTISGLTLRQTAPFVGV